MATTGTRITAEQYFGDPRLDGRFVQLVNGELVLNYPSVEHQRVCTRIAAALVVWTDAGPGRGEALGGGAIRLTDFDVYIPDALWVSDARHPGRDAPFFDYPPDLVVEVRSPSTWRYDVGPKKRSYERAGLRELWLVDPPERTVTVLRRSTSNRRRFDVALEVTSPEPLTSPMLPGFSLDLARLFA